MLGILALLEPTHAASTHTHLEHGIQECLAVTLTSPLVSFRKTKKHASSAGQETYRNIHMIPTQTTN